MKIEPQLLNAAGGEIAAQQVALGLAVMALLLTAVLAFREARRGPSARVGWLSGAFVVVMIIVTVLIGATAAMSAEICTASQYGVGDRYHGRRAADGSRFDTYARNPYTVAHRTHRFGTMLTITNLANGRSIRAKVTDRGPFVPGRCVDLGRAGADALGMGGLARVSVE